MKKCNSCGNTESTCDESTSSVLPIISPLVNDGKSDCGTCGGLQTDWELENGYEATLLSAISKDQLPTFDENDLPTWGVKVSELPYGSAGLITFTNGNSSETFEYTYDKGITVQIGGDGVERQFLENIPGNPGVIYILKRGIHPAGTNLIVDGEGGNTATVNQDGDLVEVSPDYNNCEFMFSHTPGETARRGTYAQEHSIFLQHTCCVCATSTRAGIMRASKDSTSGACPVAITNDDFANCTVNGVQNVGIVRGTSKCMEEGDEYVLSYNDYATDTRAGIVKVSDTRSLDCSTNTIQTITPTGDIPETALNVGQHAFPGIYGSVQLSRCIDGSIAVSKNDNATCDNNGLVVLKPMKANHLCPNVPSSPGICGDIDTPARVVQEYDYADFDHQGLVLLSKQLNSDLPCPVVVTKHDNATCSNNGIVTLKQMKMNHPCPDIPSGTGICGDGANPTEVVQKWDLADDDHYGLVKLSKALDDDLLCPVVVTKHDYSNDDNLGITLQSVNTSDCDTINSDSPTPETPIATSTNDKRNFHQVAIYERDFTVENGVKGRGLLIDGTNINAIIDEIPFNGGGYPGEGFVLTNTGPNAITPKPIDQGEFYCYESMVPDDLSDDFSRFTITQGGAYQISCNLTVVNTKSQLEIPGIGNSSTVTYSIRVKTNSGIYPSGTLPISDIQQIMTTQGDPAYNATNPLYGEPVRACTIDDHGVVFLNAGDEIWLSISTDQPDCYLTTASLSIFCIQPNL